MYYRKSLYIYSYNIFIYFYPALLNKGDNADYICNVIGQPKPEVTWLMNDRPIKRSRYSYPLPVSTEYGSKLILVSASEKNQGELKCVAENENSRDVQSIKIQVASELFSFVIFPLSLITRLYYYLGIFYQSQVIK